MSHAVRLVTFTYLGKGWCVPVGQITVAGSPVDMDRRDWTQDIRHGGKQVKRFLRHSACMLQTHLLVKVPLTLLSSVSSLKKMGSKPT